MRVFISWSGDSSRAVADALRDWLPRVINAVDPFLSTHMEKGVRSLSEMAVELDATNFGVVCITPENLREPWIHFEAGALSKRDDSRLWTFLTRLKATDVAPPLAQFQHTQAEDKEDVRQLVLAMDRAVRDLGEPTIRSELLTQQFETLWPLLEERLLTIGESQSQPSHRREQREIIEEALELLRALSRTALMRGCPIAHGRESEAAILRHVAALEAPEEEVLEVFANMKKYGAVREIAKPARPDNEKMWHIYTPLGFTDLYHVLRRLKLRPKLVSAGWGEDVKES